MKKTNEKERMNEMTVAEKAAYKFEELKKLYEQILLAEKSEKEKFARQLLLMQKEDGSWSVIDDYRCDSDIRVHYVYLPTYYATAALMNIANSIEMNKAEKSSLSKGLEFAMGRNLMGHGYDSMIGQLKALEIYKNAGMYEFFMNHVDVFENFRIMIANIIEGYKKCVEENRTIFDWMVDFREDFVREINDYESGMTKYVWYAAYGSNICVDRFKKYINACTNQADPVGTKNITIPYSIYFAGRSRTWGGKAVAYLDDSRPGMSWGRMYLITYKQYCEIQRMEGTSYSKKVLLGEEEGIPIYTFTSIEKRKDVGAPDLDYIKEVLKGLKEAYETKTLLTLETYLYSRILNDEDYKIINFVRSSSHGVPVHKIDDSVSKTMIKKSVSKLISYNLFKQDSRSIVQGHSVEEGNAVVYTVKEKREVLDLLLINLARGNKR